MKAHGLDRGRWRYFRGVMDHLTAWLPHDDGLFRQQAGNSRSRRSLSHHAPCSVHHESALPLREGATSYDHESDQVPPIIDQSICPLRLMKPSLSSFISRFHRDFDDSLTRLPSSASDTLGLASSTRAIRISVSSIVMEIVLLPIPINVFRKRTDRSSYSVHINNIGEEVDKTKAASENGPNVVNRGYGVATPGLFINEHAVAGEDCAVRRPAAG